MPPTSDAQICNLALLRIGSTATIDSLDEPSEEARVCAAIFDHHRDALLAAYPWPFATKRAQLALLPDTRQGWAYAYALPADFLAPQRLWTGQRRPRPEDRHPFSLEHDGDKSILLTDAEDALLIYTARIQSPLLSSAFREALSWALAVDLALALRKDGSIYAQARQEAEVAKQRAMAQAANSETPDRDPPPSSLSIRGGATWRR